MLWEVSCGVSFVLLLLLERVFNAVSVLLYRLVRGDTAGATKGYASIQMLGAGVTFFTAMAANVTRVFITVAAGLLSYGAVMLVFTFFFTILYILQEYYPETLLETVTYWNDFIGPFIHTVFIAPVEVLNILFGAIVPLYNTVVWILTRLFYEVGIASAIRDIGVYRDLGVNVAGIVRNSAITSADYITSLAYPCADAQNVEECFGVGGRTLDVLTPMINARSAAVAATRIGDGLCAGLTGPMNILIFPFLDINFAKGVHNLINSVLYTLFQVPSVTAQRCKASNNDLILCLPDFAPSFNFMVAGLRSLGRMADNWLDVSTVIIESSLGFDTSATECEAVAQRLRPANIEEDVFGKNETVVVGLTEGLYAVTDGLHVQYFNHYDATESVVSTNLWPFPIDVSMGVAAVVFHEDAAEYDGIGNPSTTMLGCRCSDNNGLPPMQIECALALYEAASYGDSLNIAQDLAFNVSFQQRSTADYMTCRGSQISVQSVRWPATRFANSRATETDVATSCQTRDTCSKIDATIWVSPLCSSSATK
ncbi:MAG: hypothetical protein EB075_11505 [Bacteroidetes bacterium]|nr:hypothetical protein [Bacteroidota bacterium]